MTNSVEATGWNLQYELGRYANDPPVEFVDDILQDLGEDAAHQFGLYVGCGNGRNFIPLLKNGLNLRGIDISKVGIDQLIERYPEAENLVRVESFDGVKAARAFDYVVAIQVFQHGDQTAAHHNFKLAKDILKPGGKLFLRVNSTSTDIKHRYEVTDRNKDGGFSILYQEGPKAGTNIHFYSEQELVNLAARHNFEITQSLYDRIEPRHEQADGSWAQWETIWQKV